MRRLLLILAFVLSAVPARAQNCVTINGISRCSSPWQIYDTGIRATSTPALDLTQTWNNLATTFTGLKLNITDTNSATASKLIDLQVAGTSKFSVTKAGAITAAAGLTGTQFTFTNGTVLKDTALGTLAMVSSAATNGIQVPNGSNLEYGAAVWASNFFNVGPVDNGGTARPVRLIAGASQSVVLAPGGSDAWILTSTGATKIAGLTTVARGTPAIVAQARAAAVTNTGTASVATFTVGAADGTFEVGCNVLVTTSTTHSFSCDVTYTDEGNTARTQIIPMTRAGGTGTFLADGLMTAALTAGAYSSATLTIRAKSATVITVRTSAGGTFTTVTYNIDGTIKQVS